MLRLLRPTPDDPVERCWVLADVAGSPVPVGRPRSAICVALGPADVLGPVLRQGWAAFLLVHTHPCGGPPSAADHAVTRRLTAAAAVVGVRFEAHVVLTATRTYVVSGQVRQPVRRHAA